MQTIRETRQARLRMLVTRHGGIPALSDKLGGKISETQIRQILKNHIRSETGGTYKMGDIVARRIEQTLELPEGWMDTPPTYAELAGEDDPKAKVMAVMEQMSTDMQRLLAQLGDTMLKQTMGTGPTLQTIDGPVQIGNSPRPMLTNQSHKE